MGKQQQALAARRIIHPIKKDNNFDQNFNNNNNIIHPAASVSSMNLNNYEAPYVSNPNNTSSSQLDHHHHHHHHLKDLMIMKMGGRLFCYDHHHRHHHPSSPSSSSSFQFNSNPMDQNPLTFQQSSNFGELNMQFGVIGNEFLHGVVDHQNSSGEEFGDPIIMLENNYENGLVAVESFNNNNNYGIMPSSSTSGESSSLGEISSLGFNYYSDFEASQHLVPPAFPHHSAHYYSLQ